MNAEDSEGVSRSAALAARLALPLKSAAAIDPSELVLAYGPTGLELRFGERAMRRGARIDWSTRSLTGPGRSGHRLRSQPLIRAMGRKPVRIVDTTAGFGDDAIALASMGHSVIALERSPIVAALLDDGLERALADPVLAGAAARMTLHCVDARTFLDRLDSPPDIVYVDPMYTHERKRSALPRLKIQLLQRLDPDDGDALELVAAALSCGARRIVVKRAVRARPLGPEPSERHLGKLVRYDVYHQTGAREP